MVQLARGAGSKHIYLRVCEVVSPQWADFVLAADVPNSKGDIFVFHCLYIESFGKRIKCCSKCKNGNTRSYDGQQQVINLYTQFQGRIYVRESNSLTLCMHTYCTVCTYMSVDQN